MGSVLLAFILLISLVLLKTNLKWSLTELVSSLFLILLLLLGLNGIIYVVELMKVPSNPNQTIFFPVGPGPIKEWVHVFRKQERKGCSTSGNFETNCNSLEKR